MVVPITTCVGRCVGALVPPALLSASVPTVTTVLARKRATRRRTSLLKIKDQLAVRHRRRRGAVLVSICPGAPSTRHLQGLSNGSTGIPAAGQLTDALREIHPDPSVVHENVLHLEVGLRGDMGERGVRTVVAAHIHLPAPPLPACQTR